MNTKTRIQQLEDAIAILIAERDTYRIHAETLEEAINWCIINRASIHFRHDGTVRVLDFYGKAYNADTLLDAIDMAIKGRFNAYYSH